MTAASVSDQSPQLPRAFTEDLYACGLPRADSHLLAAFSGGADSTALLHMLWRLAQAQKRPFRISAVHVHHGIRGTEADRDAEFCRLFCAEYGIPFTLYRCDVPMLAAASGRSIEEEAREQRYAFFAHHIDGDPGITHLLTAHHADDQAETILFRMLRGTALNGLSGIPMIRPFQTEKRTVPLIRPLLRLSKQDLLTYCSAHALSYVTDSTNLEPDCARNLLRTVILPAVNQINPAFTAALQRLSAEAAEDASYLQTEAEHFLKENETNETGTYRVLPLSAISELHSAIRSRVLALLYAQSGIRTPMTDAHIRAMTSVLRTQKSASVCLPNGYSFFAEPENDRCYIAIEQAEKTYGSEQLPLPAGSPVVIWNRCLCFFDDGNPENEKKLRDLKIIYKFVISTHINSDKLLGSIFVRRRCTNDTDRYLCGRSLKTARDALSAHKVPRTKREDIPLFCDAGGILWIPFCGIRDSVNPRLEPPQHPKDAVLYYFYNEDN